MDEKNTILIENDYGPKFKPLLGRIKEKIKFLSRRIEKGIVNKKSGTSFSMREDGEIGLTSGKETRYKINRTKAGEVSHTSVTRTNRKVVESDDIIINGHKLNPQVYEMADMVAAPGGSIVGNLTMDSTVLVKAWEPTLEKYVLIRRPARIALFHQQLNTAPIHQNLGVNDSLEEEFDAMTEEEQGESLVKKMEEDV